MVTKMTQIDDDHIVCAMYKMNAKCKIYSKCEYCHHQHSAIA